MPNTNDQAPKGPEDLKRQEERKAQVDARMREAFERMEQAKRKNEQLGFDLPDAEAEDADMRIAEALLGDETSRDARYNGVFTILRLLRDNLPSGKDHEEGRSLIRKEIRCYLNRGKEADGRGIVGADMKQADLPRLQVSIAMLRRWVRNGATAAELYGLSRAEPENGIQENPNCSAFSQRRS